MCPRTLAAAAVCTPRFPTVRPVINATALTIAARLRWGFMLLRLLRPPEGSSIGTVVIEVTATVQGARWS